MTDSIMEIQISYNNTIPKNKRVKIKDSESVLNVLLKIWDNDLLDLQEEVKLLLLNRANEVLGFFNVSKGGTSSSIVDTKLIFSVAIKTNAHSVILAHNHPSGNLKPSKPDIQMTNKIKSIGDLLTIPLLDHLIIAKNGYYSFADDGLI